MGLIDDIKTGVGASFCSAFNTYDRANRLLAGVLYPDRVDSVLPRSPAGQIAASGIALFCNKPPVAQPTGYGKGRCADNYCIYVRVQGTVTASGASFDNGPNVNNSGVCGYLGPLSMPYVGPDSQGRPYVFVQPAVGPPVKLLGLTGLSNYTLTPDHYRQNGLPDTCTLPPFTPLPEADRTTNVTINNNTGPIVFLPPVFLVNGTVNIPFSFDVGELNFSGTLELNTGEINLNFGGQPTQPDYPVVPTPDTTPPDADDDEPENEKKANIIGVIVVATPIGSSAATEVPMKFSPDLFIPRLANVSFQIRIKNRSHWTSDLPVKSRNAYISCPGEIHAIDVAVQGEDGWAVSATPVRGIVPGNPVVIV